MRQNMNGGASTELERDGSAVDEDDRLVITYVATTAIAHPHACSSHRPLCPRQCLTGIVMWDSAVSACL